MKPVKMCLPSSENRGQEITDRCRRRQSVSTRLEGLRMLAKKVFITSILAGAFFFEKWTQRPIATYMTLCQNLYFLKFYQESHGVAGRRLLNGRNSQRGRERRAFPVLRVAPKRQKRTLLRALCLPRRSGRSYWGVSAVKILPGN